MSFNRLPALEAQPTQYRDEPETQDDPEFDKFSEDLSTKVSTVFLCNAVFADSASFSPSLRILLDCHNR